MRRSFWLCLIAVVLPAAHGQEKPQAGVCPSSCPAYVAQRLGGGGASIAASRIDVCDRNNQRFCKQTVHTSIEEGKCVARFDYCVLCVISKERASGRTFYPTIVWELDNTGTYRFVQTDGIYIGNATSSGSVHFKDPTWISSGKRFSWKTGPDLSGGLDHKPLVFNRSTGEQCTPKDPIIVNAEN